MRLGATEPCLTKGGHCLRGTIWAYVWYVPAVGANMCLHRKVEIHIVHMERSSGVKGATLVRSSTTAPRGDRWWISGAWHLVGAPFSAPGKSHIDAAEQYLKSRMALELLQTVCHRLVYKTPARPLPFITSTVKEYWKGEKRLTGVGLDKPPVTVRPLYEVDAYLLEHDIYRLLEILYAQLVMRKPEEPASFIYTVLTDLQVALSSPGDPVVNLRSSLKKRGVLKTKSTSSLSTGISGSRSTSVPEAAPKEVEGPLSSARAHGQAAAEATGRPSSDEARRDPHGVVNVVSFPDETSAGALSRRPSNSMVKLRPPPVMTRSPGVGAQGRGDGGWQARVGSVSGRGVASRQGADLRVIEVPRIVGIQASAETAQPCQQKMGPAQEMLGTQIVALGDDSRSHVPRDDAQRSLLRNGSDASIGKPRTPEATAGHGSKVHSTFQTPRAICSPTSPSTLSNKSETFIDISSEPQDSEQSVEKSCGECENSGPASDNGGSESRGQRFCPDADECGGSDMTGEGSVAGDGSASDNGSSSECDEGASECQEPMSARSMAEEFVVNGSACNRPINESDSDGSTDGAESRPGTSNSSSSQGDARSIKTPRSARSVHSARSALSQSDSASESTGTAPSSPLEVYMPASTDPVTPKSRSKVSQDASPSSKRKGSLPTSPAEPKPLVRASSYNTSKSKASTKGSSQQMIMRRPSRVKSTQAPGTSKASSGKKRSSHEPRAKKDKSIKPEVDSGVILEGCGSLVDIETALLARYVTSVDGMVPDESGNGFAGEVCGAADGVKFGNHVVIAGSEVAPEWNLQESFSVAMWVRMPQMSAGYLFCKVAMPENHRHAALYASNPAEHGMVFYYRTPEGPQSVSWKNLMTPVDNGHWHHVALVMSHPYVILYVDGIEQGIRKLSGPFVNSNSQMWLGKRPPNDSRFVGHMAVTNFYSIALGRANVVKLMNDQRKQYSKTLRSSGLFMSIPKYDCVLPAQVVTPVPADIDAVEAKIGPFIPPARFWSYEEIYSTLNKLVEVYPKLAELAVYGKSTRGYDMFYLRVTGPRAMPRTPKSKPRVLLTAAIHGKEKLSTSLNMCYLQRFLALYGHDEGVTRLMDTREIYFVPMVSPDSFISNTRKVDGVDPSRNFPRAQEGSEKSAKAIAAPVKALMDLQLRFHFQAFMSTHSHGRLLMYPWGDQTAPCPNAADYERIGASMRGCTGDMYTHGQGYFLLIDEFPLCHEYKHPVLGTEIDWFYRQGCFSMLCEFGRQHWPTEAKVVETELEMTWDMIQNFVQEAPMVRVDVKAMGVTKKNIENLDLALVAQYSPPGRSIEQEGHVTDLSGHSADAVWGGDAGSTNCGCVDGFVVTGAESSPKWSLVHCFTIGVTMRQRGKEEGGFVILKSNEEKTYCGLHLAPSRKGGFTFHYHGNNGKNVVLTWDKAGLPDGDWHSVVLRVCHPEAHLIIDGNSCGFKRLEVPMTDGRAPVMTGKLGRGPVPEAKTESDIQSKSARPYNGDILDMFVYNRALSETELSKIKAARAAPL